MSDSREQITARMGMDLDPIDQAITKAKSKISDFAQHSGEHMDRAAESGRMLHRVLNQISDISPKIGLAITAAFSAPLAGIELFRMGLEAIKEHYAELKKAAEEQRISEERLRNARGDDRDAYRRIKEKLSDNADQGSPTGPEEKARLEAIELNKADIAEAEEKLKQAKDALTKARSAVAGAKTATEFRERELEYERAEAAVNNLDTALDHLKDTKTQLEIQDKQANKEFKDAKENEKKLKEENKRLDELDLERKKNLRAAIKDIAREEQDALVKSIQIDDIKRRMAEQKMAPFRPSMTELANFHGPNAVLARRIIALQNLGKEANMIGRKDILDAVQRALYGYDTDNQGGGIAARDIQGNILPSIVHHDGLTEILRQKNILAPNESLIEMQKSLTLLATRASGSGIKIDVNE